MPAGVKLAATETGCGDGGPPFTIRSAVEKNAFDGTLVLVTLPGSRAFTQSPCEAMTLMPITHVEFAARLPPLNEKELLPAAALTVPPHVVVAPAGLALKMPDG